MRVMIRWVSWAVVAWVVVGCGEKAADGEGPVVVLPGVDGGMDGGGLLDRGAADEGVRGDGSAGDGSADGSAADAAVADMGGPPVVDCAAAGQPVQAFSAEGGGLLFGDVAGDFTVNTLDGRWNLRERWSGCESYVFLNYFQDLRARPNGPWMGDQLFASGIELLVADSPRSVHYFFTSYEPEAAARLARMTALRDGIAARLETLQGAEEAAFWMGRLHFVTDRLTEIEGSVGAFASDYLRYLSDPASYVDLGDRGMAPPPLPQVFGIDRGQRWDAGGSLDPVVGATPTFAMAAWLGHFYDYHAALRARVASEVGVTVVPLVADTMTDRIIVRTVELPDAATMAGLDRVAFDVGVVCALRNPFACSEWDRLARIEWCSDETCVERHEVVRWITPYWRRGPQRWVMDASPFHALMAAGGRQTFRVELGPDWERATEQQVAVSLRLSGSDEGPSSGVVVAFGGGAFDAAYNEREPVLFTPPAGAARVELVVILSGHGQTEGDACAEWCDHRHLFSVNGMDLEEIRPGPGTGNRRGCAPAAGRGAPPGQWGNWAPGRAYWCPGEPVATMRFDISGRVRRGEENALGYRASFRGGPPRGGDIALSSYVVWYGE